MKPHTHQSLCQIAQKWLMRPASQKGPGCTFAIVETQNCINSEVVDAIGFRKYGTHASVLVEVKVSRADFLADAKKPHRINPKLGLGAYRYFMAPEGVISVNELPERWGLIEVNARGHVKVVRGHVLCYWLDHIQRIEPIDLLENWQFERNQDAEISLLTMLIARVGDPQKTQEQFREMYKVHNRMATDNNQLRAENQQLKAQNATLIYQLDCSRAAV